MPTGLFKGEGAGNDFILGTGSWAERLADGPELAARLCHRRRGVGADGTLALFAEGGNRLRVVYRNSDGGLASFCANGTRCAARVAVEVLGLAPALVVETGWQPIGARVETGAITLDLPAPPEPVRDLNLEGAGRRWPCSYITIGVPHLVVPAHRINELDLTAVAPALRHHPDLGVDGANVDFVEGTDDTIDIRSWERGVEGETLCCGSGVVAAALVAMAASHTDHIVVHPESGDRLTVRANGAPPHCPSSLCGPATIVAEIKPRDRWLREY